MSECGGRPEQELQPRCEPGPREHKVKSRMDFKKVRMYFPMYLRETAQAALWRMDRKCEREEESGGKLAPVGPVALGGWGLCWDEEFRIGHLRSKGCPPSARNHPASPVQDGSWAGDKTFENRGPVGKARVSPQRAGRWLEG